MFQLDEETKHLRPSTKCKHLAFKKKMTVRL